MNDPIAQRHRVLLRLRRQDSTPHRAATGPRVLVTAVLLVALAALVVGAAILLTQGVS